MGAPKLLAALALIAFTLVVVLPTSLHLFTQALGADLPPYFYPILAVTIGVPTLGFIGFDMWQKLAENRRIRRERRQQEAIEEQSYGCIHPQVLDSFVVFPVRVNKRALETSTWVEMGEEAMVVNLCAAVKVTGAVDTSGPLRRLCGFGPHLASNVAHSIKEAMQLGISSN